MPSSDTTSQAKSMEGRASSDGTSLPNNPQNYNISKTHQTMVHREAQRHKKTSNKPLIRIYKHQRNQKFLLENLHFKNKLKYQSKNSLELYKENNYPINHLCQRNINVTSEKHSQTDYRKFYSSIIHKNYSNKFNLIKEENNINKIHIWPYGSKLQPHLSSKKKT